MAETLISTGNRYESLPERYERPVIERPNLSQVVKEEIPLIDLGCSDRVKIVRQMREACRLYGFFQVINHGLRAETLEKVHGLFQEMYHLTIEDIRRLERFNVKKERRVRLPCFPLEECEHYLEECVPHPSCDFKEVVSKYCTEVREVGFNLLEYISESLGLEKKYMKEALGEQGQHMAMNFYPPCPKPELTYGLPGHTDPNSLTIHLQDQEVAGLQVYRAGKWITVNPHPGALVVTIGDQIQALSNNKYKSVSHRAIVNSYKERISMDSFLCPGTGAVIGPSKQVGSEESSTIYRDFAMPSPLHQL